MVCSDCYNLVSWLNPPSLEAHTSPSFQWKSPFQLWNDDASQHCDLCKMLEGTFFGPRPHLDELEEPELDEDELEELLEPIEAFVVNNPTPTPKNSPCPESCEFLGIDFSRRNHAPTRDRHDQSQNYIHYRIRVWRESQPVANMNKDERASAGSHETHSSGRPHASDIFLAHRDERFRALQMFVDFADFDAPKGQRFKAFKTDIRQMADFAVKEYKGFWGEIKGLSDPFQRKTAARFLGPTWRKPILDNTGSEAVAQMTAWLRDCVSNHLLCRRGISSDRFELSSGAPFLDQAKLPSRVLDVGSTELAFIKLVETNPDTPCASYVALSHCWGPPNKRPLRTTLDTLHHHIHDGIPDARLPKTFADAVNITRSLGVRYLWIDSLCIVQDDEADWAAESEKMGSIYEGATLTLAAAYAHDSSEGFYFTERPNPNEVVKVITPMEGDREPFLTCFVYDPTDRDETNPWQDTPLSTRAWVMQEWHLSRRVLWSDKGSFMWKCRTANLCEQEGTNTEIPHYDWNTQLEWSRAVVDYSKKELTYEKDRLIALRGMANSLSKSSQRRGEELHFGIWIGGYDTPHLLLWHGQTRAGSADSRQGIPTWSWASIPGPKLYPDIPMPVLRNKVIDEVGGITTARGGTELHMRAPICQVRLFSRRTWRGFEVTIHPAGTLYDTHEVQRLEAEYSIRLRGAGKCCDAMAGQAYLDYKSDVDSCSSDPGMTCYAIFLLRNTGYSMGEIYQSYKMLLVEPTFNSEGTKVFRRVGIGSSKSTLDGDDPFFSTMTSFRKKKSCRIPVEDIVLI